MKKIGMLLLAALLVAGCSTASPAADPTPSSQPSSEPVTLKILGPTGAPALSLIGAMQQGQDVTLVDGTDVLQAAFVNPTPEYDVIVAPSNLGAKLAEAGNSTYKMKAVVTWGNLYLVAASEQALQQEGIFAAFGENAVPGKVLSTVMDIPALNQELVWYNSVAEVQAAMLAGQAQVALMAEPAATATISKAAENGVQLQIVMDLQQQWQQVTQTEGYPQAALFVRGDLDDAKAAAVDTLLDQMRDYLAQAASDGEKIQQDVEAIGAQTLGVPSGAIIARTWPRMNLNIVSASEVRPELEAFLNLFGVTDINAVIAE